MKGFLYWSAYNNIVETLHMDAAPGRLMNGDAGACGNALAMASRDAKATPELFLAAVRQFLSTADARTCTVSCDDPAFTEYSLGFEARRHGDFLYVTRSCGDERLQPGMRIVAAGRSTIPFLLKDTAQEIFWGRDTDREDWDLALRMFADIDVFPGDGHVQRLELRHIPLASSGPAAASTGEGVDADASSLLPCAELSEPALGAALLAVRSLADPVGLTKVLDAGHELLARCDRLVLDLRRCTGEADPDGLLALLPYLVDVPVPACEVIPTQQVYTIYSKANAERLVGLLETARAHTTGAAGSAKDPSITAPFDEAIAIIRAKEAQVLAAKRATTNLRERRAASEIAEEIPSPFAPGELVAPAPHAPARVAVLLDTTTGVGAERLAAAVRGMAKVQLVGRATPGAIDYATYLTAPYPDIRARFTYPISRTAANHDGAGFARSGLPLDVHVPFTPEECTCDTILAAALAALG